MRALRTTVIAVALAAAASYPVAAVATTQLSAIADAPLAVSSTPDPLASLALEPASAPAPSDSPSPAPSSGTPDPIAAALAPAHQSVAGVVGTPIAATDPLQKTGFTSTVTYTISPDLPAGLSLNDRSGVVSGTPKVEQSLMSYTVTGTDGSTTADARITISINPPTNPSSSASISPDTQKVSGTAGLPIGKTSDYTTSGFSGSVDFIASPSLPTGLSLDGQTGAISGTPTIASPSTEYTVTANDGTDSASAIVTIVIVPTLLPDVLDLKIRAEEDIQPTEPFDVTTFPGVPEFSVEPLLPDGLSIDPATGVISGAPAAAQPRQDYVISARIGTLVATSALSVAVSCWDETASGSDCVPAPLELGGTPAYPGGGPQMQLFGFSIANNPFHKQFDSTTTDTCASCHRAHTDKWQTFVPGAQSVSELCFTCHDGTGAPNIYNVQAEYTGATPNDSATRSYFSHDAVTSDAAALQSNPHFSATVGPDGETVPSQEFEAVTPAVTNRHSQCTDCHNPHFADATKLSAPTPTGSIVANAGWTASTLINGASGVSVNNALPAPDKYALLGAPGDRTQLEYQLCFKCHSGYTNLPANNGKPSQDYIDKAVELDPNNGSFHPVEGPGTNNTPDMAASLAGASPYKLWTFNTDQTVRCTNCHSGPDKTAVGTAAQVSPTHVSTNRGILILNYRDRNLRPVTNTYDVSDFALCFGCHTDTPMSSQTGTATNFRFHGKHVSGLGEGSGAAPGPSIDTPGAGKGDALCAECHFRIHSPVTEMSESGGTQTLSGTRLVSFSPNVEPVGGVLSWTSTGVGRGSCTLRCHGYTHNNKNYIP